MSLLLNSLTDFCSYFQKVLLRLPGVALRPSLLANQAGRVAGECVGLAILVGLSLGAVAWLHAGMMLKRFEASAWLPTVLMTAVVLEFGPIAVGLIAASRLASGLAAELGAMKVTEQLDALALLGVCPIQRLVAPRVLATALILPPLTVLVDYAALIGSLAAELWAGELSWRLFVHQGLENLHVFESCLATSKPLVFGILVAAISCWQGLRCPDDTTAVGNAATRSVLYSTLAILTSNVVLVRLIQIAAG